MIPAETLLALDRRHLWHPFTQAATARTKPGRHILMPPAPWTSGSMISATPSAAWRSSQPSSAARLAASVASTSGSPSKVAGKGSRSIGSSSSAKGR